MKIAIRYFTKSKKGNTYKLAKVVSEAANVEALTVENDLEEEVETLFLVNAMYAFNIDKEVKESPTPPTIFPSSFKEPKNPSVITWLFNTKFCYFNILAYTSANVLIY